MLSSLVTKAQKCAFDKMSSQKERHEKLQSIIDTYLQKGGSKLRVQDEVIRIPTVIHVIHNNANNVVGGTGNRNISDEQVFSQMKVLNDDFRKKLNTRGYNTNPFGADMQIEFFLAQTDPEGRPSSGINRIYSSQQSFDVFRDLDLLSSLSYWNSDKYLNVWVTNLSGTYLGYGEFPGAEIDGLELTDPPSQTDGVFIDFEVFGNQTGTAVNGIYTYGRTLTHEIGHWLGLLHTWGDERCGDDYCADTPPTEREYDGDICIDVFSRCNGVRTRNMIENYMDYSPDTCMNIFTADQKARTRAVLELSKSRRRLVLNSQFLLPYNQEADFKVIGNPGNKAEMAFQILLPDFQDFTLTFYDFLGREVYSKVFDDYPSTVVRADSLNLPSGPLLAVMQGVRSRIVKRIFVD